MCVHLRYCVQSAQEAGITKHPELNMKELNIHYQHATPKSICGQWWFWNCKNAPEALPKYITVLCVNPIDCIGSGVSKKDAEKIANHNQFGEITMEL
jgi:hypothetical protein